MMQDKPQDTQASSAPAQAANGLRSLTAEQFAALGANSVAYVRQIDASQLAQFMPGTGIDPAAGALQMLFSADGTPVLVTDSVETLDDWLDERSITRAIVH